MRNRLVALALLAVAIVVLVVFFVHSGSRRQPPAVPLTTLAPATVTRVVVKKQGKIIFALRRGTQGWEMTAPQKRRTNNESIRALLASLDETTARHYSASALNLADTGLDPPRFTLDVGDVRLSFGTLNQANLLRYVRRGDTVYMVMDRIAPLIARGPGFFAAAPPPQTTPHAGTAGG
ncbi:MAG: DUF4340 domain-containing protein [Gammaproteobacteria bacterium]